MRMKLLLIVVEAVTILALIVSFWPAIRARLGSALRVRAGSGWRRRFLWACCGLLAALGVTPAILLAYRLLLIPTDTVGYNAPHSIPNARLEYSEACPTSARVTLVLTIQNVDVSQDSAEMNVSLCVGNQALQRLEFPGTDRFPLLAGMKGHPLSSDVRQAAFTVTYQGSLPEGSLTRKATIGSILNSTDQSTGERDPVNLGVWTIPLLGNSSDYPLDSYTTSGIWVVGLPSGTQVVLPNSIHGDYIVLPEISATPGPADLEWHWGNAPNVGWALVASRAFPNGLFIFVLLLLPILLFFGLLLTMISRKGRESRDYSGLTGDLIVGVGAFLIALLPVRAVLVPPDVPQFTFVDYVLGTEMAVMVAATLILATIRTQGLTRQHPPTSAREAPESGPPTVSLSHGAIDSGDPPSDGQPSEEGRQ
jgi:hypothetical protein